jgi:hypothetical protein
VKTLHEADLALGAGSVVLPEALARKYPSAPHAFATHLLEDRYDIRTRVLNRRASGVRSPAPGPLIAIASPRGE